MLLTLLLDFHYGAPPKELFFLLLAMYLVPILIGLCLVAWGISYFRSKELRKRRVGLLVMVSATLGTVGIMAWLVSNTSIGDF
jgi:hypothetical protein